MSSLRNRSSVLVALAATSALALSACGGTSKTETATSDQSGDAAVSEAAGGTITAAAAYETTNYDPSSTSSALALGSNWHVMEGLYELDMHDYKPFRA